MSTKLKFPLIRKLVLSPYLDIFAVILILGVSIYRKFQFTSYKNGEIIFSQSMSEVVEMIKSGAYPLGFMAIIGAVFSMLSTRFVGKQNNTGNYIGIATTVNSGLNDYLFRNPSALLTYPITFVIHSLASYKWAKGEKIKKKDKRYYFIIGLGFIFSFTLVYLGFYLFGTFEDKWLINTVAITFGLSLGATVSNIFKYEETWVSWCIYNVFQLLKAFLQFNYANVAKYIFYLFNASITLFDWKFNGDKTA